MLNEICLLSEFPTAHFTIEPFEVRFVWLGVAHSCMSGQEVGPSECLLAYITFVGTSVTLELKTNLLRLGNGTLDHMTERRLYGSPRKGTRNSAECQSLFECAVLRLYHLHTHQFSEY